MVYKMERNNYKNYIKIASLNNSIKKSDKFLVVGESHYFNTEFINANNVAKDLDQFINDWYTIDIDEFCGKYLIDRKKEDNGDVVSDPDYDSHKNWFKTQVTFEDSRSDFGNKAKEVNRVVARAYLQIAKNSGLEIADERNFIEDSMEKYDFMNYFQRPELNKGRSIKNSSQDGDVAWKNMLQIIENDEYKGIIVLSKKVGYEIQRRLKKNNMTSPKNIYYLSHVNYYRAWNRERGESWLSLINILEENN